MADPESSKLDTIDITAYLDEYRACVEFDRHGNAFRAALPDGCEPTGLSSSVGYLFDSETFTRYQESIEALATSVDMRKGKTHAPMPYRFEPADFVRFIGWYVTEGCISKKEGTDSVSIWISQYDPVYRDRIEALLEGMDIDASESDNGYYFGSAVFGRFLERECGVNARGKRLPDAVWTVTDTHQELLLSVLMDGDGDDRGRYTTASPHLRDDVLRLCLGLGIKPRYTRRGGCWTIYANCVNDRLSSTAHVTDRAFSGTLYRLALSDYSVVMAGRNGKFQWMGVSEVS